MQSWLKFDFRKAFEKFWFAILAGLILAGLSLRFADGRREEFPEPKPVQEPSRTIEVAKPARAEAAQELSKLLIDLQNTDPKVVRDARLNLARMHVAGDARVMQALTQMLSDPDGAVRLNALHCVEEVRPEAGVYLPILMACLADSDAEVRAFAAMRIGLFGTTAADAVPTLKRLAQEDPDEKVRERSKDALYNIRVYEAVPREF